MAESAILEPSKEQCHLCGKLADCANFSTTRAQGRAATNYYTIRLCDRCLRVLLRSLGNHDPESHGISPGDH